MSGHWRFLQPFEGQSLSQEYILTPKQGYCCGELIFDYWKHIENARVRATDLNNQEGVHCTLQATYLFGESEHDPEMARSLGGRILSS